MLFRNTRSHGNARVIIVLLPSARLFVQSSQTSRPNTTKKTTGRTKRSCTFCIYRRKRHPNAVPHTAPTIAPL